MKKPKKNVKSWLILSWMMVLFLGFQVPEALANPPKEALKGALPIPGTSQTSNYLTLTQFGTILENDGTQLVWQKNGNLTIMYYNTQEIWSSETRGKGYMVAFDVDGRLMIKGKFGDIVWTAGDKAGNKLMLRANRNLELFNSSNQRIWQSNSTMPLLGKDQITTVNRSGNEGLDYMVPNDISSKYITIHAEGADGGKRQVKESWGDTRFTVNGGSGATIKATFAIGDGDDQIPKGAILRVIAGEKGATYTDQDATGCSGGGGTGVLFRRPGDLKWTMLMVAGGGGGAFSTCCGSKYEGKSAEIVEDGGKPGDSKQSTAGKDGHSGNWNGSSGGGALFAPVDLDGNGAYDYNGARGWPGGASDPTILPTGGKWKSTYGGTTWGFGGGGHGTGGGGGYSGGSHGEYKAGGGGGSYMTSKMKVTQVEMIKNPTTKDTQDGFVTFEFVNEPGTVVKMFKLASAPRKCVHNTGSKFDNGNNIQLFDCHPAYRSQQWVFDENRIHLAYNNTKCMDVENHQTANATDVRIWDCMDHNEQKWIYDGLTQQFRSFLDLNKCLNDAYNGSTANGTNIMLWDCNENGGKADQWVVNDVYTISDPTAIHYFVPVKASGLALQSADGAQSGSNVQLGTKNTNDISERWVFDGRHIKYSPSRDLCLTVQAGDTSNGTNILLRGCSDNNAKKWVYNGITRQFHSALDPDKCLEVATSGGVFNEGMNIQLMDCNGLMRQKFIIQ